MLSRFSQASPAAAPYRPLDPGGERADFIAALRLASAHLAPFAERNQLLGLTPVELERLRATVADIGADARALGLQKLALRAYAFEFRIDDYQGNSHRAHQSFEFRESFRYLLEVISNTISDTPQRIGSDPDTGRKILMACANDRVEDYVLQALGAGVAVDLVTSGQVLFEHLATHHVDLLLLGAHLPDITLLETLDQLGETPATAMIPSLVLSEDAGAETSVQALIHGATDVLPMTLPASEAGQRMIDVLTTGRQRLHRT